MRVILLEDEEKIRAHAHYWIIETPDGLTSKGVCKRCGTERNFPNIMPDKVLRRIDYSRRIRIELGYDKFLEKVGLGS